ncbi:MAG TPA: TOBE domain-containing protein, partial [Rhodospirillales bacterium]|nr:TOBE domain-containing protein [Rhodospirillales bacterium]
SLSLVPPERTSVLNVFEGRIAEVGTGDGAQVEVLVDVGAPLIARVTRRSVHDLGLAPGTKVYAMVKSVAVDRHSFGGRGSSSGGA